MIAHLFSEKQFRTVVINTEHASLDRGLAQELADALAGPCYSLAEIRADSLLDTVRKELER
jgi:magnesium chelatase subunit ChlD-like protein